MDILILQKNEDGSVMPTELGDLPNVGELGRLETQLARRWPKRTSRTWLLRWIQTASPAVLVYENLWAAPFASAMRRAGGQLIANGRIPVQALIAAVDADAALEPQGV